MGAPAITVRCECGEVRAVPYPETWVCETCGRRWNTGQIPAEHYERILERVRASKVQALQGILVIAVIVAGLSLFLGPRLLLMIPVAAAGWYLWLAPRRRRDLHEYARSLPSWNLRPE